MDQPNRPEAPSRQQRPVPAAVRWAVRAMYAGAAESAAGAVVYIVTWYFRDYVVASRPGFVHGDSGLSIAASAVVAWLVGLGGLVVVCLWLWIARMCAQGRNWARILATALLALRAYTLLAGRDYLHLGVPWIGLVPGASFLIGLAAVILLWQRSSTRYFKAGEGDEDGEQHQEGSRAGKIAVRRPWGSG